MEGKKAPSRDLTEQERMAIEKFKEKDKEIDAAVDIIN